MARHFMIIKSWHFNGKWMNFDHSFEAYLEIVYNTMTIVFEWFLNKPYLIKNIGLAKWVEYFKPLTYIRLTSVFINQNIIIEMIVKKNDEVFYCYIQGKATYNSSLIIKILIALNKYYGDYSIYDTYALEVGGNMNTSWQDFILDDYQLVSKNQMGIEVNIPFSTQIEKEIVKKEIVTNGLSLFYGAAPDTEAVYIGINIYVSGFTNLNYEWIDGQCYDRDESKAASINRKVLRGLLKTIEKIIQGNIIEYSSEYIDETHLYKYGIKEDAVLLYR